MTLGIAPVLNIVAGVVLAVSALALAIIMIWQNPTRRGRYFAVSMVMFALYAIIDLRWQLAHAFLLDPRPTLEAASAFYVVSVTLLVKNALVFARVPGRARRLVTLFSLPLAAGFLYLIVQGEIYFDFEPTPAGAYQYALEPVGLLGVGVAVVYLSVNAFILWRHGTPRSRALVVPFALMALGMAGHGAAVSLRIYGLNTLAVTTAIVMIGRTLLHYEVFQPLADLNQTLAEKNAELQKAARLKSQFLANMTHELRTPLNSIIGYTDMIVAGMYGDLSPLQTERLLRVNRNGLGLLALINDVLILSKIEAGRLELARARTAVSSLLEGACSEAAPKAAAKGLALTWTCEENLPPIFADETRLRHVLDKLLANALNFTEHGQVTLHAAHDPLAGEVVLRVRDTGCGVDPALGDHIFEPFVPGNSHKVDSRKGAGLGLAIAHRVVALHGGRLWYESVPGQGATFCIALAALDDKMATAEHSQVAQGEDIL